MSKIKLVVEQNGFNYERYGDGVFDIKFQKIPINVLIEELITNGINIRKIKLVPYSIDEYIIKVQKDCPKTVLLRDLVDILSKQLYCKAFSVQKIK